MSKRVSLAHKLSMILQLGSPTTKKTMTALITRVYADVVRQQSSRSRPARAPAVQH